VEPKVIVIAGPTCSGKTKLSLNLAKKINIEIISADSRQLYKYLDIGTAKPSSEDMNNVKHHFIDILFPDEEYNVSRFETEALSLIGEIINRGKIPVVIGGSGLYIKALVDGIFNTVETDAEYRAELFEKRQKFGNEFLYDELKKIDEETASKMLPQNWKRVIRALEVFHLTGKSIRQHHSEQLMHNNYTFTQFGLDWERKILYQHIEKRVDEMINSGLVEEVRTVLEKGYDKTLNSLNTVGYKEIISYLDGTYSLDRAVELIKRNTRRYAKRQLTWFRADDRIKWFKINSEDDFDVISNEIIKYYY